MVEFNGKELLFFCVLSLVVGVLIGHYAWSTRVTGAVTCPNYECVFDNRQAIYQMVGSNQCSGEKGIVFGTDECTVKLLNTENEQSAKYIINFNCKTINTEITKTSNEVTLAPGQTGDFTIKFKEAGNLDWNCKVASVTSSAVKGCILKQK